MTEKKGIDVSYAQGNIDFAKISKNEVRFAVIRSSYGWESGQKDSKFDRNIQGFQKIGIPCGVYHYSYAQSTDDAVKEAEYCLSCIKGYSLQLPVFYDLENSSIARLGKRTCTDIAKTFCDRIKKSGFQAGIYMNRTWLQNYVYQNELTDKYPLWLAQWGTSEPSCSCFLWQYKIGTAGCISGIDTEVDLDILYSEEKTDSPSPNTDTSSNALQVGDVVKISDPIDYDTGKKFNVYDNLTYKVLEVSGERVVIGSDGQVTAAVNAKYLQKVNEPVAKPKKTYTYIIRPNDTLTAIAKKYDTTVQNIVKENRIENPDLIYSGQILKITV